jgi:hypothetical protein
MFGFKLRGANGTCNGEEVSGEVCVPYEIAGKLVGMYGLIISS